MKSILLKLLISCNVIFSLGQSFAESASVIVNIDNPDFRRLIIAIPTFQVKASASEDTQRKAISS